MEGLEQLKIVSKEGKEFFIPKKNAELSTLLKTNLQEFSIEQPIPVEEVEEQTLKEIITYLNYYAGNTPPVIEKPIKSSDVREITDKFSAEFIEKFNLESLVELTLAADYMDIQPLLDLTCAKFACMSKDKSDDEIFKTFGITAPFTEEEKQKVIKDNPWVQDNI